MLFLKINNLSFKHKLTLLLLPLVIISLILLFLSTTFINDLAIRISELGNEEVMNLKIQTLNVYAKDFYIESNVLLYTGKDAVLKTELKEDQAAENFITQLEILNGKI